MSDFITNFMRKRFVPHDIFEARNSKLYKVIFQTLFVSMLLANPMVIAVAKAEQSFEELPSYVLAIYIGVFILNLVFLFVLSFINIFVNSLNSITISVRQFFSFYTYASTIPALVALIAGLVFNIMLVYFIYNFGLVLLVYLINRAEQRKVIHRL